MAVTSEPRCAAAGDVAKDIDDDLRIVSRQNLHNGSQCFIANSQRQNLMLRILLRLCNEVFDTFDPVKSSPSFTNAYNKSRTYKSSSSLQHQNSESRRSRTRNGTYFELDSIFTESFTSCRVFFEPEAASLLPPEVAAYEIATVLKSVPRARYSFLMARPRIVLALRVSQREIKHLKGWKTCYDIAANLVEVGGRSAVLSFLFPAISDLLSRYVYTNLDEFVRPPGEMASRLTTNQEIAGSTPAVVIWFLFFLLTYSVTLCYASNSGYSFRKTTFECASRNSLRIPRLVFTHRTYVYVSYTSRRMQRRRRRLDRLVVDS